MDTVGEGRKLIVFLDITLYGFSFWVADKCIRIYLTVECKPTRIPTASVQMVTVQAVIQLDSLYV